MGRDYATIDRFEGETAVIEQVSPTGERIMTNIPRSELPETAAPGDKVYKTESGEWLVDKERTEDEQKRIRSLMDSLFE